MKNIMKYTNCEQGASLLIVLIMVMVIAITSAAAIRGAISNEALTNNLRVQNLAQQYAEAALRYCEAELQKADATRVATLREANIPLTGVGGAQAWLTPGSWHGVPAGARATLTALPAVQVQSGNSTFSPARMPECVVERQTQGGGAETYVITARGYSPDYRFDNESGATTAGSVVWLQSELFLQ